ECLPVHARRGAWSYRAGRFVLRHRIAVGVATVANLAMVAGLTFAAYQAYEANRERERAERHFANVRQLANVFIFDVYAAIDTLPGSVDARKLMIQTALDYLERLSAERRSDLSLQIEIARAYGRIGDILGGPNRPSLEDKKGAHRARSKVKALLKPVLDSTGSTSPAHRLAQNEMAKVLNREASAIMFDGRAKEAVALLHQALPHAEAVTTLEPRALPTVLSNLALAHSAACDDAGYERYHQKTWQAWQELLAKQPADTDALMGLVYYHNQRAFHLLGRDASPDTARLAAQAARLTLQTVASLRGKAPDNAEIALHEALAHGHLGFALGRTGHWSQAAEELQSALALTRSEIQREPRNILLQTALAEMEVKLSQARLALHRTDDSVALARAAVRRYEALQDDVRNEKYTLNWTAQANYALGQALLRRSATSTASSAAADGREACDRYGRAAKLLEAAERKEPNCAGVLSTETVRQAMRKCSP
ncbi:hypothetical protein OOT46_04220, partial [Aquabacterium sp. A7-Y]|uniref:hypothetical protein n=1 Tax=Aquabacterium sp. A7-Y TaxID=1349605 RepID=UPI00223D8BFD